MPCLDLTKQIKPNHAIKTMATLRQFLDSQGFDWRTGYIVIHPTPEEGSNPGWEELSGTPFVAPPTHEILDKEFYDGYGGPKCPRFVARDKDALYFPIQYDGATCCCKVFGDLRVYLSGDEQTPYPGG
jgi:hypothetical protein